MRRLQGRALLLPRPDRADAPVDVLVYDADSEAASSPLAVGSLSPGHRLPDAAPRDVLDLVLAEREDATQAGATGEPTVLRSTSGWAPADLPTLGTVLAGELLVHPRHAEVTGGRPAADDQRLRGAFRSRSGGVQGGRRSRRAPAGHPVTLELWWGLGHDATPQAWVSTRPDADGSTIGWPVLDVPVHLLGGTLPATVDDEPTAAAYVVATLRGPEGDIELRPAGRARTLTV